MQTLHWCHCLAVQNQLVTHRLHAKYADLVFHEHRQHSFLETIEVGVHHVQRHLHGVEREAVSEGGLQHLQMDVGALVAGESNVAQLALFLRFDNGFHTTAFRENAGRIRIADDLVKLQKVHVIGLQPAKRLFDLISGSLLGAAVNLRHEKGFLPVTIAHGLAHADFALPVVVVPGVVEEINSAVERGANDADALLLVLLHAEVVAAKTDHRHLLASASKRAPRDACRLSLGVMVAKRSHESGYDGSVQEATAIHEKTPTSIQSARDSLNLPCEASNC